MNQPLQHLPQIIHGVNQALERLILVIGPSGSGKTSCLRQIADNQKFEYVAVGARLSDLLLDVAPRNRPLAVQRLMEGFLPPSDVGVCLDNLDLLFLPELRCDPFRLVALLSQHRLVVAAFTGSLDGLRFTRAYTDHPEYISTPLSGLSVIALNSGQTHFLQT